MALTFQAVRQACAARILANMTGWTQSDLPLEDFGRDPSTVAHKRFICWFQSGQDTNNLVGKQSEGSLVMENLTVRFSWKIPPKDKLAAYDSALEDRRKLIALLSVYQSGWPGQMQIIPNNWDCTTLQDSEYYMFDVNFLIYFQLDLTI